jgi:hypothetical protein
MQISEHQPLKFLYPMKFSGIQNAQRPAPIIAKRAKKTDACDAL